MRRFFKRLLALIWPRLKVISSEEFAQSSPKQLHDPTTSDQEERLVAPETDQIEAFVTRGANIFKAECGHASKNEVILNCFGTLICADGNMRWNNARSKKLAPQLPAVAAVVYQFFPAQRFA